MGRPRRQGPSDQVGRWIGLGIPPRRGERTATMAAHKTGSPHQTRAALAPTPRPCRSKRCLDPRGALRATACLLDLTNLLREPRVALSTGGEGALAPGPIATGGDPQ